MQEVRAEHQQQDLRGVLVHHQAQVGDGEGHHRVVEDVLRKAGAEAHQHGAAVVLEHLDHAQLLARALLVASLGLLEDRRVIHPRAHPVADGDHRDREPEGHAPAPGEEFLVAEGGRKRQQGQGRQQVAQRHAGLGPTGPEAAAVVWTVFGDQQDGAAPFATEGEALDQPQQHQEDGRGVADAVEAGQAAHEEGGDTDYHQADLQQVLAPQLVAEMAEHQAAQGAGEETHGVEGEGGDDAVDGVAGLLEEQLAEYQRGGGAIEEEFVPLGHGAGHGGGDHAFQAGGGGAGVVGG
ncbi:hypothetical protein D9M70_449260 [compost metagenome]